MTTPNDAPRPTSELIGVLLDDAALRALPILKEAAAALQSLEARKAWLESLFDFSDPEVALHHAPNDPVTVSAVIVRLTDYEAKNAKVQALEARNKELEGLLKSSKLYVAGYVDNTDNHPQARQLGMDLLIKVRAALHPATKTGET